jgi:hypothetical protein
MKSKIVFLLLLLLPGAATSFAQSGKCGANLTWTLSDGTLRINGTGAMTNYSYSDVPWYSYRSSIEMVIIGNSVTGIGNRAFEYCESLASVTIGNSVTNIGSSAFSHCTALTSVTNLNPQPQAIGSVVFYNTNIGDATLYVPAGSVERYKATLVWQNFGTVLASGTSAINTPTAASAIRVYSNPATGSLHIEGLAAPTQVTVINMSGQTVWRQTVAGDGNISTGHLPRGVYLVHVNGQTMKIIK